MDTSPASPRDCCKGSRVSQGDVVGFVGATGLASGRTSTTSSASTMSIRTRSQWPCPARRHSRRTSLVSSAASTEAHLARIDLIRGFNLAQAD
jgi:hypothetical protein